MSVHIQKITLPAGEQFLRTPLDWEVLKSVSEDTKVLTFVRYKSIWNAAQLFPNLSSHPRLASALILLKPTKSWDSTRAIYPVSTLEANNNLLVDTASTPARILANTRRVIPGKDEEVYVVCVEAKGKGAERQVVKTAVETARKLVGGRAKITESTTGFWDSLGICTWESFKGSDGTRHRPTLDMLLNLVPDLPIKTFLIDDGWQDIRSNGTPERTRLHSFGPWDGMGADMPKVVSLLKEKGCQEIGVWFTLEGNWFGIDPNSELIKKYDCVPHQTAAGQPRGGVNTPLIPGAEGDVQWLPSPEKAAQFWEDWFYEMKSWGVSFVKCDNQAFSDMVISPTSAQSLQALWSGFLAGVVKVWGSTDRLIMCMSHNDRMLNGPGALDFSRPEGNLVFRNSDDFNLDYPGDHADFCQFNTYQTILTSHLSLTPDFDMFASAPDKLWPTFQALLRALTPGPVLLSDTMAVKSDRDLLSRLVAKGKDGQLRAVKTLVPVSVLHGRWFWDNIKGGGEGPAIIGASRVAEAHGAIVGIWNARSPEAGGIVKDRISLEDVEDALGIDDHGLGNDEYILWSLGLSKENKHKFVLVSAKDHHQHRSEGLVDIVLGKAECEAVVVAKVWHVGGKKAAVVGMSDKLAPLAGINGISVDKGQLIIHTRFESSSLTVLVFGESRPTAQVTIDNWDVTASSTFAEEQIGSAWKLNIDVGPPGVHDVGEAGKEQWEVRVTIT